MRLPVNTRLAPVAKRGFSTDRPKNNFSNSPALLLTFAKVRGIWIRRMVLAVACVAATCAWAHADEPGASYIFPAGGQTGTVCRVRIGGLCLHDGCGWEMLGSGVQATRTLQKIPTLWFEGPMLEGGESQQVENYPQDYAAEVTIAPDAPLGARPWRVWTSQGAAPALKFVVGDLPEIIEREIDGEPIPVGVSLPITINGRVFPREDIDIWSFQSRQGELIHAEVCAARLGSPLDARLEVTDANGRRLAENNGSAGGDPKLTFTAPADGVYHARIHDLKFGGLQSYVYRLTLTRGPRVEAVYPLGGRRGAKVKLELIGPGAPATPLEVALPASAEATYLCRFELPGSAPSDGKATSFALLELDDLPEALEQAPNDDLAQATEFAPPLVLNGRIERPGDVDCYRFTAKKDDLLDLDLRASRLGSPLDSVLVVLDAAGKEFSRSDDIAVGQTDSRLRFKVPADGTYTVRVEERLASRGGPTFAYRLRVTPAEPDFRLVLASDALTVPRGGQGKLRINVDSIAPVDGPVRLTCDGLPEGVTLAAAEIPAKAAQFELKFNAAETAEIGVARLTVRGVLATKTGEVARVAAATTAFGEPPLESLLLGVALPTPFKLVSSYAAPSGPRGSVNIKHFTIERNGFTGPLEIRLADRQARYLQGVTGPTMTAPAEASEFNYPVFMPPWMELGRTSRTVIMASGTITDAAGRSHIVCFSTPAQNEQIIARTTGNMLDVHASQPSLLMRPGEQADLNVTLSRDAAVSGEVTLELVVPEHMAGIAADKVVVPAGKNVATLRVRFSQICGPINMPVAIRATTMHQGHPLVGECPVELVAPR